MMYVLLGVISPYDGSDILGVFDSLESAQKGRSEYRRAQYAKHNMESYESYPIYERELNIISDDYFRMNTPVDDFRSSQGKKGVF